MSALCVCVCVSSVCVFVLCACEGREREMVDGAIHYSVSPICKIYEGHISCHR